MTSKENLHFVGLNEDSGFQMQILFKKKVDIKNEIGTEIKKTYLL